MKILLATDGSEYSEGAARFLTGLNLSSDDEIVILHVVNWTPILSEWESLITDFKEIMEEVTPKILNSAAEILKPLGVKITTTSVEGYPDRIIADTGVSSGADLVVMGARGTRGIGSYIVGSVTKAVAINSPKPVLVIKPPQQEFSGRMRVLFATDGSVYSDVAGKVLSLIPFPDDTEVTVMNVVFSSFSDIPERFAMEIDSRIKENIASTREKEFKAAEAIIAKTREYLGRKFSNIEDMIRFGYPSSEILSAAKSLKSDIIVVGSSGMRGISGMLGSVSRKILNQAECSVLVGKTE